MMNYKCLSVNKIGVFFSLSCFLVAVFTKASPLNQSRTNLGKLLVNTEYHENIADNVKFPNESVYQSDSVSSEVSGFSSDDNIDIFDERNFMENHRSRFKNRPKRAMSMGTAVSPSIPARVMFSPPSNYTYRSMSIYGFVRKKWNVTFLKEEPLQFEIDEFMDIPEYKLGIHTQRITREDRFFNRISGKWELCKEECVVLSGDMSIEMSLVPDNYLYDQRGLCRQGLKCIEGEFTFKSYPEKKCSKKIPFKLEAVYDNEDVILIPIQDIAFTKDIVLRAGSTMFPSKIYGSDGFNSDDNDDYII